MAGDSTKASIWTDADVYVGALDAENPADADTVFGSDWDFVGLLDGDAGFGYTRDEEETDLYAWGGIVVRTSRRNFKQSVTFTLLEDNDVTRELVWPGSSATELYVVRVQRVKIAFETREGAKVKRLISTDIGADVKVDGDFTDGETDLTKYTMRATIFPDAAQVNEYGAAKLFDRQESEVASS